MLLLDELRADHVRIDRALGALRTYVAHRLRGDAPPASARSDGARFVRFFRVFADRFHHSREEGVLFPALLEHLEIPGDRGPIAAITQDHVELRAMLSTLATLLDEDLDAPHAGDARARLEATAIAYSRALWLHIDAETSVLFPECEERLVRAGVRELPTRAPTPEQAAARDDGDALALRFPPMVDLGIVRGEGCAICPSFGVRCDGIEREWWSELEWDEFPDRVG
jgi:hemerythrin-like domain-containing protein